MSTDQSSTSTSSSPSSSSFAALGLPADLVQVLADQGITAPTPIQAATLPDSLAGRDVLGRGRTGSGKTYGFLLPVVARLAGGRKARAGAPRALILAPTRELVAQIEDSLAPLAKITGLRVRTIFGGVSQNPQVASLRSGVDVVIACPGRLEDLIGQGHCDLSDVEVTVLDEADHMADLGFLPGVRRLLSKTPKDGQRLFFSATLDKAVDALTRQFLSQPVTHEADSAQSPVATMTHHVLQVEREQRLAVLTDLASAPGRTVVFARTKHGAKGLARQLNRNGVPAVDLHGNLGQNARTRNLEAFHEGRATVLVATDIAARGIHVDDVTLVVHADPPAEHKAYLHRSGRTARAGSEGTVVTLMTQEQAGDVRSLTKAAGIRPIHTRITGAGHPVLAEIAPGDRARPGAYEAPGAPAQGNRAPRPKQGGSGSRRPRRKTGTAAGGATGGSSTGGGQSRNRNRSQGKSAQGSAKTSQGGQGGAQRRRSGGGQGAGTNHSAASFSSGGRRGR